MNASRISEAHLGLRRMYVHIDGRGIDLQEEDDRRMAVEVERFRGPIRRVGQNAVPNQSAVDEKELIATAPEADPARHVTGSPGAVIGLVNFREVRLGLSAQDLNGAVVQGGSGRQIENEPAVVLQAKGARRERQRIR